MFANINKSYYDPVFIWNDRIYFLVDLRGFKLLSVKKYISNSSFWNIINEHPYIIKTFIIPEVNHSRSMRISLIPSGQLKLSVSLWLCRNQHNSSCLTYLWPTPKMVAIIWHQHDWIQWHQTNKLHNFLVQLQKEKSTWDDFISSLFCQKYVKGAVWSCQ